MSKISISKEQLSQLPPVLFDGEITVVESERNIKEAINEIRGEGIVGFDTETRPSFKKGVSHQVALIQVSTLNKSYLLRINKLGINSDILEFLEDRSVTKIGLSLKDDMRMLHKICEFSPQGFIDLQNIVKDYSIADTSLQKVFGIVFGSKISKGQRLTNWEAEELTLGQMNYAAIDAWACLKIYNELVHNRFDASVSQYILEEDRL